MLGKQQPQRTLLDAELWAGREIVPSDSFYGRFGRVADSLVSDETFAACYKATGRPSISPALLTKVLLLALHDDTKTIALSDSNGSNILKIEIQPGKVTLKAASKVVVEAPLIELVENATHPGVFGDNLTSYLNQVVMLFNSHMHPGQVAGMTPVTPAPPTPQLSPPTPSLLSTKVTLG